MSKEKKLSKQELAKLLEDREHTHGAYEIDARVAQDIKQALRYPRANYSDILPEIQESLDHIATKMARIVAGDASHPDHWDDIAGYAMLAKKAVEDDERPF